MSTTGADALSVSDRDLILQAMAACCAARGYRETTVEEVLERAGVGRESFDCHFSSKEDCAIAALNLLVSETLAGVAMTNAPASSIADGRKFEILAILQLMAARPTFARLGYVEARQCGTARMHDAYESAGRVLALMMQRTTSGSDGTRALPAMAARAALGGAEAVVRRELVSNRGGLLPRLLPDFVYAALVPFVGQREALRQASLAARLAAEEES